MASSAIEAGRAFLKLLVDDVDFAKGLEGGLRKLEGFGRSALKVGAAIGAVGATITAPFVASVKVFSAVGSALNDMSERTGVSVERLSELKYAAQQTGTDLTIVEGALRRMSKLLAEADAGSDSAAATINKLGLSVRELIGLEPGEQFAKIARAIGQINDPTARAAAAMEIFGKSGTLLLPMIKDLDGLTDSARKLGVTMSTQAAKDADAYGDSMDTLKAQLTAIASAIGAAVAPALTKMATAISNVLPQIIQWVKDNPGLVASVAALGVALVAVGSALATLAPIVTVLTATAAGLAAIGAAAPIIAGVAAVLTTFGIVLFGIVHHAKDAGGAIDTLTNKITTLAGPLKEVIEYFRILGEFKGAFDRVKVPAIASVAQAQVAGSASSKSFSADVFQSSGAQPGFFGPGGIVGNSFFNIIGAAIRGSKFDFERNGRQESRGLRGFDSVPQKALEDFEKQTRPLLATFNGRLAGQIFGGTSTSPAERIAKGVEKQIAVMEKERSTLEGIEKNTRRANQFTAGNV